MKDEYRLLLIDPRSPAIEGSLIDGLAYHYPHENPFKAIVQKNVNGEWIDIIIERFEHRYMEGDMDSATLKYMINDKPCVRTRIINEN